MGSRPKPVENTGKFKRNITAAINGNVLWHFGQIQCFIRADGMIFHAGNIDKLRRTTNRDQNFASTIDIRANADLIRASDPPPALNQGSASIFQ